MTIFHQRSGHQPFGKGRIARNPWRISVRISGTDGTDPNFPVPIRENSPSSELNIVATPLGPAILRRRTLGRVGGAAPIHSHRPPARHRRLRRRAGTVYFAPAGSAQTRPSPKSIRSCCAASHRLCCLARIGVSSVCPLLFPFIQSASAFGVSSVCPLLFPFIQSASACCR
jgi:hypothetical protein